MKDLIKELREETALAIENNNRQTVINANDASDADMLRHSIAKAWAELQLLNIPNLAKKAAAKGKNSVAVVSTKDDYYATNKHSHDDFGGWNYGASGLKYWYLHMMLTDREFEVDVKFEHDGVGISSWYTMYIKW